MKFLAWRGSARVSSITAVQPMHVAAWIEASTRELAALARRAAIAGSRENKRLWSLELDFHKSHRLVRPVHDVVLDPGRPVIGLPRG